jgi:hypothetical protein
MLTTLSSVMPEWGRGIPEISLIVTLKSQQILTYNLFNNINND